MQDDAAEDAELVAASARGDEQAFAVLVRRHIRSATLLASQLLGDQDEAEDVVQDAFGIVYRRAGAFREGRPFGPWLYGIVRRLASNRRRTQMRRAWLLNLWRPIAHTEARPVDEGVFPRIEAEDIRAALARLSPMQRACFELVIMRDLSIAEVAAMHGISESTVRQHVFRARQAMAESLKGCLHE